MNDIKSIEMTGKQEKIRMSHEKDGKNISYNIEEIENGWLITIDTSWTDKKDGYKYETKKFYSKTNPLSKDVDKFEVMENALKG